MKALSRIEQRLLRSAVEIEAAAPEAITYQHTVFCQTGLPYRNPGAAREWERRQGNIALCVSAGEEEKETDERPAADDEQHHDGVSQRPSLR